MTGPRRVPLWLKVISPIIALAVLVAATRRSPSAHRLARGALRKVTGVRAHFVETVDVHQFQRGSVHAHSLRSDGRATYEAMITWYRDHHYQFVAMTEHNQRIDPAEASALERPGFVVIAGEEVTNKFRGRPVHVNSLCAQSTVGGGTNFQDPSEAITTVFAQVREHGGIPLLNHPNYGWALDEDTIARGASGYYLLEVWSAHPDVHPEGDDDHVSAEAIWDGLLARGAQAAPAAVDDAHQIVDNPHGGGSTPGRGWVQTFGGETTRAAICSALGGGRLYASNGPELGSLSIHDDVFRVGIVDPRATVEILGERGELLARPSPLPPAIAGGEQLFTYHLQGGETLVRARVTIDTAKAWTPAYRVDP